MHTIITHSAQDTMKVGERLAKYLKPGDILCLFGDLGTGKTTLVKGLTKGLKINPRQVNSPTFVLMNIYEGKVPVYHFDLYRIEGAELPRIGYEEFFYGDGVAVVEWAERLGEAMPPEHFAVHLEHRSEEERAVKVSAGGPACRRRLKGMTI